MRENVAESNFRSPQPMIPSSTFLPANSLICNILRATRLIAIFCRPKSRPSAPNSNEFNNLANRTEKTARAIHQINTLNPIFISPARGCPASVLCGGLSFSR